jgi:hypothetical protein
VTVVLEDDDTAATQTLDEFCHTIYGRPLPVVGTIQAVVHGTVEQVAETLRAYATAGVTDFVVRVGSLPGRDTRTVQRSDQERLGDVGEGHVTPERQAFVETYVQLWNQSDPGVRRQTVGALWASDGANFGQDIEAVGHEAINDRVTRSYERYVTDGSHYFRAASDPVEHHGAIKVEWEMI